MKNSAYLCATDCFLQNEFGEILFIHRESNREILPDFYNGIGGKMEYFETPIEAINREITEETGSSRFTDIILKGLLTIKDKTGPWQIFIFTGTIKKEYIKNTHISEGRLEWVPLSQITNKRLVPDLFGWINLLWQKQKFFFAKTVYDNKNNLTEKVSLNIIK